MRVRFAGGEAGDRTPSSTRLALATMTVFVVACSSQPEFTTLGETLDHQPAALVTSFEDGFLIGDAEAPLRLPPTRERHDVLH